MTKHRDAWTQTVTKMTVKAAGKAQERRTKYGAQRVTVDGITFHSKREAARYYELKLMEKAGLIRGLELQPRFTLNTWHGDHSLAPEVGDYVADFMYEQNRYLPATDWTWERVVEDVKGFKTPLYLWKKKHVEAQYDIKIHET